MRIYFPSITRSDLFRMKKVVVKLLLRMKKFLECVYDLNFIRLCYGSKGQSSGTISESRLVLNESSCGTFAPTEKVSGMSLLSQIHKTLL